MSFPIARRRLLLAGAAFGAPGALAQGRDRDVLEISKHETATTGGGGKAAPSNAESAPALIISIYNMKRDAPVAVRDLDLRTVMTRTYGRLRAGNGRCRTARQLRGLRPPHQGGRASRDLG